MITRKQRDKALKAAKDLFNSLSSDDLWKVGDDLVFGCFDWKDYWDDPPPKGTANELWKLIQNREEMVT